MAGRATGATCSDLEETQYSSLDFTATKGAANFLLTDNLAEGATKVPFGRTVTFTFQLVDEDEVPVADRGQEIRILAVQENDGRRVLDRTRTYTTDEDGRVELSFRLYDPDSRANDRDGTLNLDIMRSDEPVIDKTKIKILTGTNRLRWDDDKAVATTLLAKASSSYTVASSSGNGAPQPGDRHLAGSVREPDSGPADLFHVQRHERFVAQGGPSR